MTAEPQLPAPAAGAVPAHLEKLVKTAKDYARRERKFAGHSLRAGLATPANIDERYVQKKHLGHASAEMTRRGRGAVKQFAGS
jgi:hypothetical protein